MRTLEASSYAEWKTITQAAITNYGAKVNIFDFGSFWACVTSTTLYTIQRNVLKGTAEETVLQTDNWVVTAPFTTGGTVMQDSDGHIADIDSIGRLKVTFATTACKTVDIAYDNTTANYVANMWRSLRKYTIPTGYNFEVITFTSLCGAIAGSSRAVTLVPFGSYNCGTNTFTNGAALSYPDFCSSIEAEVTTAISGAVIITVTYTNELGQTGRTGTITLTGAGPLEYKYPMTFQGNDLGASDITAVSDNNAVTGVVTLYGVKGLLFHRNNVADFTTITPIAREGIILNSEQVLSLEITGTNTTSTRRGVKIIGLLYQPGV